MKKCILLGLLIPTVLFYSCKNDDDHNDDLNHQEGNYSNLDVNRSPIPLKVGNEWVYDRYNIKTDSSGEVIEKVFSRRDTIKIVGDTLIDGERYYEFSKCISCAVIAMNDASEFIRNDKGRLVGPENETSIFIKDSIVHEHIQEGFVKSEMTTRAAGKPYNSPIGYLLDVYYIDNAVSIMKDYPDGMFERTPKIDGVTITSPSVGLLFKEAFYVHKDSDGRQRGIQTEIVSYTIQ